MGIMGFLEFEGYMEEFVLITELVVVQVLVSARVLERILVLALVRRVTQESVPVQG